MRVPTLILLLLLSAAAADENEITLGHKPELTPATSQATLQPNVESGLVEYFATHFHAHEPTYFLVGSRPTAKFQFSLKYELFDLKGWPNKGAAESGAFVSYSQT